jgi:hypothetical protein
MAHAVIVKSQTLSSNADSHMRNAVARVDLDNGNLMRLNSQKAEGSSNEVWEATVPVTGELGYLWMACSPWAKAKGESIEGDPRELYNVAGKVFDAFLPHEGDLFVVTADALAGTQGTNTYVIAVNESWELNWAAAPVAGTFAAKLVKATTIGDSMFNLPAFKFEVVHNPAIVPAVD